MLSLKQWEEHEWEFVHPEGYGDTLDKFHLGCDLNRADDLEEAEKIFKAIVGEIPDHLDALHHWALVREKLGDLGKAKEFWEKAVSMGRKAFPKRFTIGKDLLRWGLLGNRPFLRCLHGLGVAVLEAGDARQANKIFMDMLKLNSDDNQGVRAIAIETFFILGQPEEALKICNSYPDDIISDTLYGRALAHFQLGNEKKADKYLKQAMKRLPRVARGIVKKKYKKPKFMHPDRITVGGEDEAYEYWERNRAIWENVPGAIDWVKAILKG